MVCFAHVSPSPACVSVASDAPADCTDPAWMLRDLFQDKAAPPKVAVKTYRIFTTRPDPESLRSAVYSAGFVFQYAARAQALLQLSVCVCVRGCLLRRRRRRKV